MDILARNSSPFQEEEVNQLSRRAVYFIDRSIADSTRRSYNAGVRNYVDLCARLNLVAFPLHQTNVILFATKLAETVSVSAIKVQLAGIKFAALKYGYNSDACICLCEE